MKRKDLESIEESGFVLKIYEYENVVRQYHDTDHDRFMRVSSEMVSSHMSNHCLQNSDEVKNTRFHIYTY